MPRFWLHNKIAVELEELVPDWWSSYNSLKLELWRFKDKPYGIKKLQSGGNGRRLLIDFDSLREEIREALGDIRKGGHILEKFYKRSQEATFFYAEFTRPTGNQLTLEEQERYVINASVLEACILLEQDRLNERRTKTNKKKLTGLTGILLSDCISFNEILIKKHKVQHSLPKEIRRFKDLLNRFKTEGFEAIIKDIKGTGKQGARIVYSAEIEVLKGLFANQQNKPSPTEVAKTYDSFLAGYAEVYNKKTGEIYDPKDFPKLSRSTIYNYLSNWENSIGTYRARSGNRQMDIARIPHAQMELPKYASSLISIDDRQPPFWYEKGKRMWFYIGLDVASSCMTTFVYGKTKEGIIVDFYRQMVRNYAEWGFGLPLELECESSLNSIFRDTLLKEGNMFKNVTIEANNAQRKIIERRFGKLRYQYEKKKIGWIARPFAKSEANQASPKANAIIPYNELVIERLSDIEDWNNMPCEQDETRSRWSYFLENQNPNLKPINYKAILPYIGYRTESSCNRGFIKLQNKLRAIAHDGTICTGDLLIDKMKRIEGKEIEIFWLDNNDGEVLKAFAYIGDQFVCEIQEFPKFQRAKAEQTPEDKKIIALQQSYINTVQSFANEQYKAIEPIGVIDNTPKPERKFKIEKVKRYEAQEPKDVVILPESDDESELIYIPNNYQYKTNPVKNYENSIGL